MTLEEFHRVEFNSRFRAVAWEFKNFNLHRAVVELTGEGGQFGDSEFAELREEITSQSKISHLRGFGVGIILDNFETKDEQVVGWVDNRTKNGRACQWVVASSRSQKRMIGCHMWQKGSPTAIFEGELSKGASAGFTVIRKVKPPEGLMRLATSISPAFRSSRYQPDA